MHGEPQIALVEREAGGLTVRVNFGVLAGRQATPAELEALGTALLEEFGDASVVAEERHELSAHSQAELHRFASSSSSPRSTPSCGTACSTQPNAGHGRAPPHATPT